MDIHMSFHKRLKYIRKENSLSQDEFANELFVISEGKFFYYITH